MAELGRRDQLINALEQRAKAGDQAAIEGLREMVRQQRAASPPPALSEPSENERINQSFGQRVQQFALNPEVNLLRAGAEAARTQAKPLAESRGISTGLSVAGAAAGAGTGLLAGGIAGSAIGGTAGTAIEQLILGGKIDPHELGVEGAVNVALDTVLPGIGRLGRGIIRSTRPAVKFAEEIASKRLSSVLDTFFKSVDPMRAKGAFNELRAKGLKIKGGHVRESFAGVSDKALKKIASDIENVQLRPGEDQLSMQGLNAKIQNLFSKSPLTRTTGLDDLDFGEAQNIRSKLQEMAFASEKGKTNKKNRLFFAAEKIDKAIERSLNQPPTAADFQTYKTALREYRLSKVHQSAGAIIRDVTKTTANGNAIEFSLGRFADILRNPTSKYKPLVKDIDSIEGLRDVLVKEWGTLAGRNDKLILDGFFVNPSEALAESGGRAIRRIDIFRQLGDSIGGLMGDIRGREYVRRIIEEQGGVLTPKSLTIGLQLIRRNVAGPDPGENNSNSGKLFP